MISIKRLISVVATIGALSFPALATANVMTWNEINAGDLVATAEIVSGTAGTEVGAITGSLTSLAPVNGTPRYQVDLFKIFVSDASAFSASTLSMAAIADTALFLFDDQGSGVYMNDDEPGGGSSLLSLLPAGDPASPTQSGFYYLGIALGGYLPYDASTLALFLTGVFTDVLAGDSNAGPLAYWDASYDSSEESPYSYEIRLTGVQIAQVPEPGSLALLLLGALAIAGLRSRRLHLGL